MNAPRPPDRSITVKMQPELYERLEAWMRDNEFRQITPAVKLLLSRALKAEGK